MAVMSGMATAISGLEANSQMLALVSDNIVNANTNGFKASRGEFQSILAQDLGPVGGGGQIGRGVDMASVTNLFSQGPISNTERATDLAISGDGFFVLTGDTRGMTFTRDGAFRFDKDGWMTNINGYRVQAYQATTDGSITGKLGDIRIPFDTIPASPTKEVELHLNLDARRSPGAPLDILRPDETAHFSTGIQIFDSVGNSHAIGMYFNKIDESTWEWYAMADGESMAGGAPGEKTAIATGSLIFDNEGRLESVDQSVLNTTFANGALPDQPLFFNFGDSLTELGTGMKGTTQYGSKNVMFRNVQNGWAAGTLADVNIDDEGLITGVYSNGQNRKLGQLAIARFEATERLIKLGENQFRESVTSGQPLIGRPNTAGRGTIMSKSIEGSNVDLAKEFVDMIKAQRGFQASSKTINTANAMLDEVIGLVRV